MSNQGALGSEVERISAEIRTWPAWAQPYAQEPQRSARTNGASSEPEQRESKSHADQPTN